MPYYCGGNIWGSGSTDECYKYAFALDEWTLSGLMPEAKSSCGSDSSESWGLIVAGGTSGGNSVETTDNGEVFEPLPNLPEENWDFCTVIIDEDRIFACGGYNPLAGTLIFQRSTNIWNR